MRKTCKRRSAWDRVTSRGRNGGGEKGSLKCICHRVEKSTEVRKTVLVKGSSQEAGASPQYPQKALDHSLGGGYLWSLLSGSTVNANECS